MDEKFRRPLGVGPKNEGEILHHERGPIRSLKMCVCVCFFFGFCFVLGPFFNVFVTFKNIFITKNMVIIYKLSQRERLCYNLRFYHSSGEITKEEKKIDRKKKKSVTSVNM